MTLEQHKLYCMGKMLHSTIDQRKPHKDPTLNRVEWLEGKSINCFNVSPNRNTDTVGYMYTMHL